MLGINRQAMAGASSDYNHLALMRHTNGRYLILQVAQAQLARRVGTPRPCALLSSMSACRPPAQQAAAMGAELMRWEGVASLCSAGYQAPVVQTAITSHGPS